jgi:biopolymer transport protein ExbD|tara:strand:+ start:10524 stop:10937 length:414 start_codon:yes stop_codon:yes gene_type:complete
MLLPSQKSKIRVNLTPLIDVVFILLIFFMLVSSFSQWRELPLEISQAVTVTQNQPTISFVVLHSAKRISLNKQSIALEKLLQTLQVHIATDAKHQIILGAEEGVALQQLITLLEKLKTIATDNVSLAKHEVSSTNAD